MQAVTEDAKHIWTGKQNTIASKARCGGTSIPTVWQTLMQKKHTQDCGKRGKASMTDYQRTKAYKIAKHYGLTKQKFQALQELNELSAVLLRRKDQIANRADHINNLIDEIADVLVMIEQIKTLYHIDDKDVSARITFKLNRQIERIEAEV